MSLNGCRMPFAVYPPQSRHKCLAFAWLSGCTFFSQKMANPILERPARFQVARFGGMSAVSIPFQPLPGSTGPHLEVTIHAKPLMSGGLVSSISHRINVYMVTFTINIPQ